MKNLYQSVQNANVPENIKKVNGLKAKYDLYDICLSKLNQLIEVEAQPLSQILGDIHEGVHNIISSFYDIFMVQESSYITLGLGGNGFGGHNDKMEIEKLNNVIEEMQNEINRLNRNNEELKTTFEQEKAEMQTQMDSLENENKEVLDILIKHSKGEINSVGKIKGKGVNKRPTTAETNSKIMRGYQEKIGKAYQESPPKIPQAKEFTYSKYGSGKTKGIPNPASSVRKSYQGSQYDHKGKL